MFNVTFNNISAISQWEVLLVEETGFSGKKSFSKLNTKVVSNSRHVMTRTSVQIINQVGQKTPGIDKIKSYE